MNINKLDKIPRNRDILTLYNHIINKLKTGQQSVAYTTEEIYLNPDDFETGQVTVSTGAITHPSGRCSRIFNPRKFTTVKKGTRFACTSEYRFLFCIFGDTYSKTLWVKDYTFNTDTGNVMIVITKDPEVESETPDIAAALSAFTVSTVSMASYSNSNIDTSDTSEAIPSYFASALEQVVPIAQGKNLLSARHGCSFIVAADHHFNNESGTSTYNNAGKSLLLASQISKVTNNRLFISLGDVLSENHTKSESLRILRDFYLGAFCYFGTGYRALFGNHDHNVSENSNDLITDDEFYSCAVKGFENEVISHGNLYYYWDNPNSGIRFICLNFGEKGIYDEAQLSWLHNVLITAPDGYSAIVLTHGVVSSYTNENTYELVGDARLMLDMLNANNTRGICTPKSVSYDYADSGCDVRIVIGGHLHADAAFYDNDIPVVLIRSDSYATGSDRQGTIGESCLDCVDIDLNGNKAYFTRLGYNNGAVREFQLYSSGEPSQASGAATTQELLDYIMGE